MREPIPGSAGGRAPNGVQRHSPYVRGSGAKPPEAESFLLIGHPKEGANWPHVRVLNERNCNFGERALMGRGRGLHVGLEIKNIGKTALDHSTTYERASNNVETTAQMSTKFGVDIIFQTRSCWPFNRVQQHKNGRVTWGRVPTFLVGLV